jgi:electron transfer flavoprotein beta subunit
MNLLVCISQTPDTTAKVNFRNGDAEYDPSGVTFIMNPFDEWYALVRAIELSEANPGSKVTAICVGRVDTEQTIRKALAIGADDAVRVDADPKSSFFVAKQIAEYAKKGSFDVIFTGKETIDYNGSEMGAMLAECLDLPYISYANSLIINGNIAEIGREIEGGIEVIEADLPLVLSAAKGMAEQRIPNMRGIMSARTKSLVVVPETAVAETVRAVKFTLPPAKTGVKLVSADNMDELVRLLHEEAKAI